MKFSIILLALIAIVVDSSTVEPFGDSDRRVLRRQRMIISEAIEDRLNAFGEKEAARHLFLMVFVLTMVYLSFEMELASGSIRFRGFHP